MYKVLNLRQLLMYFRRNLLIKLSMLEKLKRLKVSGKQKCVQGLNLELRYEASIYTCAGEGYLSGQTVAITKIEQRDKIKWNTIVSQDHKLVAWYHVSF